MIVIDGNLTVNDFLDSFLTGTSLRCPLCLVSMPVTTKRVGDYGVPFAQKINGVPINGRWRQIIRGKCQMTNGPRSDNSWEVSDK